jgi:hypothetical protein
LLEQAGAIRTELVGIQGEANVLRQTQQELPSAPWKTALPLALLAAGAGGGVAFVDPYWLPAGAVVGGALAVLPLLYCGWRLLQGRSERRQLELQIGALEERREEVQARLTGLEEQFRRLGLPASAVDVARMAKNLERHRQLLRELAEDAGAPDAPPATHDPEPGASDALAALRRQEAELAALPEQLRRIEAEGEQLRLREEALTRGGATPPPAEAGDGRVAALLAEAGSCLAQLTAGRYGELRHDGDWSLRGDDGAWHPLAHFSGGTAACVRLAAQLALARAAGGGHPLPLLLDEPLSALDRQRAGEALRLLERLAGERQVVLASRDETLLKRGQRERWQVVPLGEQAPRKVQSTDSAQERSDDDGQLHLL